MNIQQQMACFGSQEAFEDHREGLIGIYRKAREAEEIVFSQSSTKEAIQASAARLAAIQILIQELATAEWTPVPPPAKRGPKPKTAPEAV